LRIGLPIRVRGMLRLSFVIGENQQQRAKHFYPSCNTLSNAPCNTESLYKCKMRVYLQYFSGRDDALGLKLGKLLQRASMATGKLEVYSEAMN